MKDLEVIRPGIISMMEDRGRFGYGDIGITQSGMADLYSGALANKLLGNAPYTPLLEISLGGAEFVSHIDTCISITGANSTLSINGRTRKPWRSHRIEPGDTIKISMASRGQRIYLAVKGGFDLPPELGSRSTTTKEGFGHNLQAGKMLLCHEHTCRTSTLIPQELIPKFGTTLRLRLLPGYQWDIFSDRGKDLFFSSPYEVTTNTDRMGCRLSGESIGADMQIISEPIAYGAVQIPPDGQPIIMLNERQTIGGYPKLGSIIPMDTYMLSQAQPGTKVTFEQISLTEALELTKKLYGFLAG